MSTFFHTYRKELISVVLVTAYIASMVTACLWGAFFVMVAMVVVVAITTAREGKDVFRCEDAYDTSKPLPADNELGNDWPWPETDEGAL